MAAQFAFAISKADIIQAISVAPRAEDSMRRWLAAIGRPAPAVCDEVLIEPIFKRETAGTDVELIMVRIERAGDTDRRGRRPNHSRRSRASLDRP